mgnify:CR=1 FL=1
MSCARAVRSCFASVMCLTWCAVVAADDDLLGRAKDLYRSAAYDEALGVLDSIAATTPLVDSVEVNEYRVFCLVALDRKDEARNAISALVSANPSYQLSEAQASPRVRAAFKEVSSVAAAIAGAARVCRCQGGVRPEGSGRRDRVRAGADAASRPRPRVQLRIRRSCRRRGRLP